MLIQHQGLFCLSHRPACEQAAGAQSLGKGHSQESWPQLTRGIFHTMWCLAQQYKLDERRREAGGGCLELRHLSSQVTAMHHEILFSWKWLNICLLMGSKEWMFILYSLHTLCLLYLFCFICFFFSQPTSFLSFTFQFCYPSCWGQVSEGCVGLSCLPELTLNTCSFVSSLDTKNGCLSVS